MRRVRGLVLGGLLAIASFALPACQAESPPRGLEATCAKGCELQRLAVLAAPVPPRVQPRDRPPRRGAGRHGPRVRRAGEERVRRSRPGPIAPRSSALHADGGPPPPPPPPDVVETECGLSGDWRPSASSTTAGASSTSRRRRVASCRSCRATRSASPRSAAPGRSSVARTTASCPPTWSRRSRASAARRTRGSTTSARSSPTSSSRTRRRTRAATSRRSRSAASASTSPFPERVARGARAPRAARPHLRRRGRRGGPRARRARGYHALRDAEAREVAADAGPRLLPHLDEAADDHPRRHVHQRHARSLRRAERLRRPRAPLPARGGPRRRRAACRPRRSAGATCATRASRWTRSWRALRSSSSSPTSRTRSREEDAEVFRALDIPAAKSGAVMRVAGKDLCWYGARSVEGIGRVRELVTSPGG